MTTPLSVPLSLPELRAAVESGRVFRYVYFWGHTAKSAVVDKACLSQWWPASFTLDGVTYASAEMYMMAEKARLMGDDETRAQILAAPDAKTVKAFGRAVRNYDESVWARERFDVVTRGSVAKFGQNADLRAFLVGTALGDDGAVLVEAAPNDAVWGIGVAESDPRARDPREWPGTNLLGFALMRARASLVESARVA